MDMKIALAASIVFSFLLLMVVGALLYYEFVAKAQPVLNNAKNIDVKNDSAKALKNDNAAAKNNAPPVKNETSAFVKNETAGKNQTANATAQTNKTQVQGGGNTAPTVPAPPGGTTPPSSDVSGVFDDSGGLTPPQAPN